MEEIMYSEQVAGALKVTSTQKQILDRQTKSGVRAVCVCRFRDQLPS